MRKLTVAFLILSGCGSATPPAVHTGDDANAAPTKTTAAPAAGMARVVLIRPESQCDSSVYPIIVDESGHFVGQISQNSQATIEMSPGDHMLFAWPSVDARVEKYPSFDPVGVAPLHLQAGETSYVQVYIPLQHRGRTDCWRITTFGLRRLKSTDTDLQGWLATTKPITIDQAAGEADIAKDPATVQAHITSGKRELERRKALREERAAAQQRPDDAPPSTD